LNTLVEEMLVFASPSDPGAGREDVNLIVQQALALALGPKGESDIRVTEHYARHAPWVRGDRDKIVRACMNVIRNALEATPPGGTLEVATHLERRLRGPSGNDRATGDRVVIRCTNSGSYIEPGERDRLFAPFYTTKKSGTGLGLAITHQIVQCHGGYITVASDREAGTTFYIELPAAAAPAEEPTYSTQGMSLNRSASS